jgi:hypothetical protein
VTTLIHFAGFREYTSIHSPRFCEYGHSLYKIPQVRFTFAIPRFCEEAHSLWNILWVIIISVFVWELFVCGLSGPKWVLSGP